MSSVETNMLEASSGYEQSMDQDAATQFEGNVIKSFKLKELHRKTKI